MMSPQERMELNYLRKSPRPLWGGHLERGQPISDPMMKRWVDLGWIIPVAKRGYILSPKGEQALQQTPGA